MSKSLIESLDELRAALENLRSIAKTEARKDIDAVKKWWWCFRFWFVAWYKTDDVHWWKLAEKSWAWNHAYSGDPLTPTEAFYEELSAMMDM